MKGHDQAPLMSPLLNISQPSVLYFYLRMKMNIKDTEATFSISILSDGHLHTIHNIQDPGRSDWIKYVVCIPDGVYRIIFRISLGRSINLYISLGEWGILHNTQKPPDDMYTTTSNYTMARPYIIRTATEYEGNPFENMRKIILSGGLDEPDEVPAELHSIEQYFHCPNYTGMFNFTFNIIRCFKP